MYYTLAFGAFNQELLFSIYLMGSLYFGPWKTKFLDDHGLAM